MTAEIGSHSQLEALAQLHLAQLDEVLANPSNTATRAFEDLINYWGDFADYKKAEEEFKRFKGMNIHRREGQINEFTEACTDMNESANRLLSLMEVITQNHTNPDYSNPYQQMFKIAHLWYVGLVNSGFSKEAPKVIADNLKRIQAEKFPE